jgi:hypothetical protein
MTSDTPLSQTEADRSTALSAPKARPRRAQTTSGRFWRRISFQRAVAEGGVIFLVGRLLAMVPPSFWPAVVFPGVLVLRLVLGFSPPVWAAMRVTSTRREKMSRRFWGLGPLLAALCTSLDVVVALTLGDALLFGGRAGPPDALRLVQAGPAHLSLAAFTLGEVALLVTLAIYFTMAVVCTRLANGGFMRFTMPAGNGRVTL